MPLFVLCLILFDAVIYILSSDINNCFGKPSFESTWYHIEAQTSNELTISHNLNEYPVKVDVQVKIQESGTDYIFSGLASTQVDDDLLQPYGGVIYMYNKTDILFIVPNKNNDHDAGGIAYTGSSKHYSGPNVVQGPYFNGSVKVRLWLACDMPQLLLNLSSYIGSLNFRQIFLHSLWITFDTTIIVIYRQAIIVATNQIINNKHDRDYSEGDNKTETDNRALIIVRCSGNERDSYKEIHHGLGFYPDLVSVQLLLHDGYMVDVQGAVMNSELTVDNPYIAITGVVFGYSDSVIRIWSTYGNQVFGHGDGWIPAKYYSYGFPRILAWNISENQKVVQKSFSIGKNITHTDTVPFPDQIDFSTHLVSIQVTVQASDGTRMIFYAVGSSLTTGFSDFGGLVYVYTKNDVYLWRPDGATGHLIYIGGIWGAGAEQMSCDFGEVSVVIYSLTDSTASCNDCSQNSADLLFIVDTSASEKSHMKSSISFLNDTIKRLSLSENAFQVAMVTYDFEPKLHLDFEERDKKSILSYLESIQGSTAATKTNPALQLSNQILQDSSYGSRPKGSVQFIVLISDGLSTDSAAAIESAREIRHNNGSILTVGVGNPINYWELLQISGRPDFVFCAYDPTSFYNQIKKKTTNDKCEECYYQRDTDIIVLLDTNKNQHKEDFLSRQYTIERLISKLSIGNSNVAIGMYQYSDEPEVVFRLASPTFKDTLIAKSRQVTQDRVYFSSNTSHALYHIGKHGFQPSFGARQSARKFILLFSDGIFSSIPDTKMAVEDLTNNNISVYGIAVGLESDVEHFIDVLPNPCHLFYVSENDYSVLDVLVSATSYINCN